MNLNDEGWTYQISMRTLTETPKGHKDIVGWQTAQDKKGKVNRRQWVRSLESDNTCFKVSSYNSEEHHLD